MPSAFLAGVGRWLFVVVFGLITFWPDFGVAALCLRFFPLAPLPVVAFACAWSIPLALALPLSLKTFRLSSSLGIAGICAVGIGSAYFHGLVGASNWWIWLVGLAFVIFGWLTICTPLWKWMRGIVAVQDSDATE